MSTYIDPLKALLDNLSEGVYMVAGDGHVVAGNRRLAELLDLPPDFLRAGDPLGKLPDFLHQRGEYGTEAAYQEIKRLLANAPKQPFIYERVRPDGRALEIRGNPEPAGGFVVIFTDVTERRRAADALRLSEERLHDLVEVASHFQWETDEELRIQYCSDSYERVPARERHEIIGRTLWDIVGVEDPDRDGPWASFRNRLIARESVHDFHYSIFNKEGRRLYRVVSGKPVFDKDGRFKGYRCATRDETMEVEARQRMQAAEDLLKQALDSIGDGFGIFDPSDRLVIMNKLYLGYTPKDADGPGLGITFEDLMHQDARHGFYPDVAGDEAAFIEHRIELHREGAGRPVTFRTSNGRWAQARDYRLPDGSTVVARTDISELVERDRALRESQASLAAAQRIAKLGSWELDLTDLADVDRNALRWSDETFRIFGYEPNEIEVSNENFFHAVHPDDRDKIREAIQRTIETGVPYSIEHRVIHPNDREIIVHEKSDVVFGPDGRRPIKMVGTVQDITEQKRTEAALQDNQARLDLALQTANAAYWELDMASLNHKLSPNYYAMLGYSEADAPRGREAWLALIHPDDIGKLGRQQSLPPNDRTSHVNEFRIRARDGSWRWILSHFRSVTFDGFGRPARLLGIDIDTTVRKQGELDLQQARERARQYLDIAGVITVVLNADHTVELLNRMGCEILGVTEAEAFGRNWFDAFAPEEEREEQRAKYAKFLAGTLGPTQDIEMAVKTRSGAVRLVTWHDVMLYGEDGSVIGAISSGEDITEQRAAERKRDEFRTLLEATSEASPDGILVTDANGRYLFWNKRLKEMWNLSDEFLQVRRSTVAATEAILNPYADQVTDPQGFLDEIARTYDQSQTPKSAFAEVSLKDGRVFVRHAARVAAGKLPYATVAWIYRDVTEQRKRDEILAQTRRLTTVGELSGGMAHELNNLLMVIGGNLELIDMQERGSKKDQTATFVKTAHSAVQRGAELIRNLLAFSRRQPLAPKLTDLNAFMADTMKILPRLLGEFVTMKFVPGSVLWQTVVDPGFLQTALVSLATNARDAMPQGGSLVIETSNEILDEAYAEKFTEVAPGQYVLITVTDNGAGMSAEVAKRAFEPFFTTKAVGKGTGLGLSVVYGFVKQSGGHVAIYSEEGHGTSVRIYLPRARAESAATAEGLTATVVRGNKECILLVEDEAPVMAVARAFLSDLGYHVLEASNGFEAMGILGSNETIDLLFTDVVLPDGMNGAEVARAAEKLRPGLKVLYASGYTQEALVHQGRLDPGVTLLPKPYRKRDLADAIRAIL
jgi:PAS domain S-box-containing protein